MIYQELANIYDALVKDPKATKAWVNYVCNNIQKGSILELACGSGEISQALAKKGYQVLASDISLEMLEKAKVKSTNKNISFKLMDMLVFDDYDQYQGIICFCDSINYLKNYQELTFVFKEVYKHLISGGVFLFDMHHQNRLAEFIEPWEEEGYIDDISYQWLIETNEDIINQYFNIIKDNKVYQEHHQQKVFDLAKVKELLTNQGFEVEVSDDNDVFKEDLQERYFIKATKKDKD